MAGHLRQAELGQRQLFAHEFGGDGGLGHVGLGHIHTLAAGRAQIVDVIIVFHRVTSSRIMGAAASLSAVIRSSISSRVFISVTHSSMASPRSGYSRLRS